MISSTNFQQMALAFPEVTVANHFGKPAFKVGSKIFATLDTEKEQACTKLSVEEQDVFCQFDKTVIFPVPNSWGKKGWTFINLKTISKEMLLAILTSAYIHTAPKKLAATIKGKVDNLKV